MCIRRNPGRWLSPATTSEYNRCTVALWELFHPGGNNEKILGNTPAAFTRTPVWTPNARTPMPAAQPRRSSFFIQFELTFRRGNPRLSTSAPVFSAGPGEVLKVLVLF